MKSTTKYPLIQHGRPVMYLVQTLRHVKIVKLITRSIVKSWKYEKHVKACENTLEYVKAHENTWKRENGTACEHTFIYVNSLTWLKSCFKRCSPVFSQRSGIEGQYKWTLKVVWTSATSKWQQWEYYCPEKFQHTPQKELGQVWGILEPPSSVLLSYCHRKH